MEELGRLEPANDRSDIRRATPFDRQVLQSIIDSDDVDAAKRALSANDLIASSVVQIAFVRGRPVGCIATTLCGPPLIHGLVVVPQERSKGHAYSLIEAALAAIPDGRGRPWTAVDPLLPGASARFEKHGFVLQPEAVCEGLVLMTGQRARSPIQLHLESDAVGGRLAAGA